MTEATLCSPEKPKVKRNNGLAPAAKGPAALGNGVIKKRKPIGMGFRTGAPSGQKKTIELARITSGTGARTAQAATDHAQRPVDGSKSPIKTQWNASNGANHAEPIDVEAYAETVVPGGCSGHSQSYWVLMSPGNSATPYSHNKGRQQSRGCLACG